MQNSQMSRGTSVHRASLHFQLLQRRRQRHALLVRAVSPAVCYVVCHLLDSSASAAKAAAVSQASAYPVSEASVPHL